MKRYAHACLFAAAGLLGVAAQAQSFRFAGVEIHGGVDPAKTLLGDISVPAIGRSFAADDETLSQLCRQVSGQPLAPNVLSIQCMVVGYPDGATYVVIDVVEAAEADRITYPAMSYIDHLKLAERGGERRSEELIACARGCAQAADRADAFDFLNRLDWGKASCKAALQALDDRDWTVRNQAAMLLNQHLDDCVDAIGSARIVDASLRQLTRPTHTDRNKAIANLDQLVRRHAGIDDARRGRILAAAELLARRSRLPNVGITAAALAELIRRQRDPFVQPPD